MRTYAPVNYNPPKAATLCGQAWSYFASQAAAGTPVTSKMLATVAATNGWNIGNLKIELSRYNRYTASAANGTLAAPTARTATPTSAASTLAANQYVQAEQIALRELAAANAPMLLLPAPEVTNTSKKGNRKAH